MPLGVEAVPEITADEYESLVIGQWLCGPRRSAIQR
jgi:hypothetical protein